MRCNGFCLISSYGDSFSTIIIKLNKIDPDHQIEFPKFLDDLNKAYILEKADIEQQLLELNYLKHTKIYENHKNEMYQTISEEYRQFPQKFAQKMQSYKSQLESFKKQNLNFEISSKHHDPSNQLVSQVFSLSSN